MQRLQVARHPNRPTFLDIVLNISDKFVELHGDRAGLDDPAIVCGLASIDGVSFMVIGHQKGRNTKVYLRLVTRDPARAVFNYSRLLFRGQALLLSFGTTQRSRQRLRN